MKTYEHLTQRERNIWDAAYGAAYATMYIEKVEKIAKDPFTVKLICRAARAIAMQAVEGLASAAREAGHAI